MVGAAFGGATSSPRTKTCRFAAAVVLGFEVPPRALSLSARAVLAVWRSRAELGCVEEPTSLIRYEPVPNKRGPT
jgi:hypothetical protein